MSSVPWPLRGIRHSLLFIVLLTTITAVTAVPGIYSIDEDHYITTVAGLRDGTFSIPHTDDLFPSQQLLAFDPAAHLRAVPSVPASVTAPPMYAFVAWPFSWFGIRGLLALQALCFSIASWLILRFTARETGRGDLSLLACGTFIVGSYSLEYAQAVWPHMLSVALVMGAVDLTTMRAQRSRDRVGLLLGAGCLAGIATGVRYQNVMLVIALSIVVALRYRHLAVAFVVGAALAISASSAINSARLGSPNPVSKGPGYTALGSLPAGDRIDLAIHSTWARVFDYSYWPTPPPELGMAKHEGSGAITLQGTVKKAVVQSSPWVIVSILAMVAALWPVRPPTGTVGVTSLRMFLLLCGSLVGTFAAVGFRDDGWCTNQRYLLEVMPFACCALAIGLHQLALDVRALAIGAAVGAVGAALVVWIDDESTLRQVLLMKVPLFAAAILGGLWVRARALRHARARWLFAILGAAIAWSAVVHGEDILTTRAMRVRNRILLSQADAVLPVNDKLAVFAYWGAKDPFGPLLLSRDIVFLDPRANEGRDTVPLANALRTSGRTLFIVTPMPASLIAAIADGRAIEPMRSAPWILKVSP